MVTEPLPELYTTSRSQVTDFEDSRSPLSLHTYQRLHKHAEIIIVASKVQK
jgi:hypothetical protein